MLSNTITNKINTIKKQLYDKYASVNISCLCMHMFSKQLTPYYIYLDEDDKVVISNGFIPEFLEKDNKTYLKNYNDNTDIDTDYFMSKFIKEIPYSIYVDEDAVGHYFVEDGYIQIFDEYIQVNAVDETNLKRYIPFIIKEKYEEDKSVTYKLVTQSQNGFNTVSCTSSRNIDVDITKNYNDDLPYDKYKEFCQTEGSGLALMYGIAGSGKTSLIKKLIYDCDDVNFLVMDFSMMQNIVTGAFVSFLLSLQNTVIIMEDCEYILRKRESGGNPLINSLLNITDGLIGDALNIRFLCTFNARLTEIDTALLRPGRLKIKYEFKALEPSKTKALCGEDKAETLAEIYNKEKIEYGEKKSTKIGF